MINCPRCDFPLGEGSPCCLVCGYKLIKDPGMLNNLPKVDYKSKNWTAAQQLRKVGEEFGEVAEAVAENNPVQIIRESLDAMQTLNTLINIVADEYKFSLDRFFQEHEEKLRRKGYLGEVNNG